MNKTTGRPRSVTTTNAAPPDTLLNNAGAEQAMLGACLLLEPRVVDETMRRVRTENLWFPTHRDIHKAIFHLWQRRQYDEHTPVSIEPLAVDAQMRANGTWNESTPALLIALVTNTPCVANNSYYIELVLACSRRRALHGLSERIVAAINEGKEPALTINATRRALDTIERDSWCDLDAIFGQGK